MNVDICKLVLVIYRLDNYMQISAGYLSRDFCCIFILLFLLNKGFPLSVGLRRTQQSQLATRTFPSDGEAAADSGARAQVVQKSADPGGLDQPRAQVVQKSGGPGGPDLQGAKTVGYRSEERSYHRSEERKRYRSEERSGYRSEERSYHRSEVRKRYRSEERSGLDTTISA